jgi:SAM-dependent methyltransferase
MNWWVNNKMDRDITISDLNIMKGAIQYRRWLFNQVEAWAGQRILEVGAGIGNYTEFIIDREKVVCLELHSDAFAHLKERFSDASNVLVVQGDVADPSIRSLETHQFDSAMCFNVLEHVEDDVLALRNIWHTLVPEGKLLLIVPAIPEILGSVDRSLGHYRRYSRTTLRAAIDASGFHLEKLHYMNSLGILGWLLNNRIVRRQEESPAQISFYSRFIVPWLSALESLMHPPIGLSLVCIARKS